MFYLFLLLHLCFKCVIKVLMYIIRIVLLREVTVFWTRTVCILNCIIYLFIFFPVVNKLSESESESVL